MRRAVEAGSDFPLPAFQEEKEWQDWKAFRDRAAPKPSRLRRLSRRVAAIAAIGLLVLLAGYFLWPAPASHYQTQRGEHRTWNLPDGSLATLNAGSQLDFTTRRNGNRVLQLRGEAFFEVTEGNPFRVNTPNGSVEVLGTSFNVFARNTSLEVACYSGKVKARSRGSEGILEPGEFFKSTAAAQPQLGAFGPPEKPPWLNGQSVFAKTALIQVFAEMERQFDVSIEVKTDSERLYTGRFLHSDLESALAEVCKAMDLQFQVDEKKVMIY